MNALARLCCLCALCAGLAAVAAVPPMINYQGKLLTATGAPVADGPYTMTFAVYATPAGGAPLWSEPDVSVQVKGGLYSVLLGNVVNLPANIFDAPERYFGVKVGADAELAPRQRIASVPFAMQAEKADKAKAADSAAIALTVPDGAITTAKMAANVVTKAAELTVDTAMTYQTNYSLAKLPNASMTIHTDGGNLLIIGHVDTYRTGVQSNHTKLVIKVDGNEVVSQWASEFSADTMVHIAMPLSRLLTDLVAGDHQIELFGCHAGNPGAIWEYKGHIQFVELKR